MPAGTHGGGRPRPLYIPSSDPDADNLEYSRLSVKPAAVQGISSLSQPTLGILSSLSFEKLGDLNSTLCRLDQVRAGIVKAPPFRDALRKQGLGLTEEGIENVTKAYALDRHSRNVWWNRLIHDCSQLAGHPTRGSAPMAEPLPPPLSPDSSLNTSYSPSPEAQRLPQINMSNATEASIAVIKDLATFCLERRINVEAAFADFQRPGKFCKRVKRVTRCQFREVLNFLLNGIFRLTDREFDSLAQHFDDGSGLVLYRDFVRAVDPYLDPGTGFSVLQMSSPPSGRRSTSPRRSVTSLNGSLSGSPTSQLLGVQPMGPPECQVPSRIEVFERVRVDDIMAKIRHLCKIYSIIMVDQLKENDRHQEGIITAEKFCRSMDVLKVLRLNQAEVDVLQRHYKAEVYGASNEPRFNYRQFCEDLQPTGPDMNEKVDNLRYENITSPFAVKALTDEEMLSLKVLHQRFGAAIQSGRISFRSYFSDFDRATKTRNGTNFNYTLNAGCISRSQFLQALRSLGLSSMVSVEDLELLFKRYEREGEFNHLVFLRDLEDAEQLVESELASVKRDRSPRLSFEIATPTSSPKTPAAKTSSPIPLAPKIGSPKTPISI